MLARPARRPLCRSLVALSVSLAVLGLGSLLGCRRGRGAPADAAAPEIAKVETRDIDVRAEASGTIEPLKVVEVKSRVAGELKLLLVDTNQEVAAGTLLAQVDPRDVKNAFEQARADLEVAKARVETTAAQARRSKELHGQGVIAAQDFETTELAATNARADLLKAQTNYELARERLGDVDIRAPIAGTIIERTVEQGQIVTSASGNVSGGTTLVKMADLGTMQARALVDEVDIGRVSPGQPVEVTVEAYPGRVFHGQVFKIEPQAVIDQNITMFPVLVHLANPERLLKSGMNAEVGIALARRTGVVAVPNAAVVAFKDVVSVGAMLGLDPKSLRGGLRSGGREEGDSGGSRGDWSRRAAEGQAPGGEHRRGDSSGRPVRAASSVAAADPAGSPDGARPGVVFVRGAAGPELRHVRIGVSDWDFTEVLSGLRPGDPVYLISVARMQQQQQQFSDRMRQNTAFGGGGSGAQGRPR